MEKLKPCPISRLEANEASITLLEIMEDGIADQQKALSIAYKALYWIANSRRTGPENKALEQLKVENAQLRAVITQNDPNFFKRKCRVCGCDWNHPCNGHDYWVEDDLCSACAARKPEESEKSG